MTRKREQWRGGGRLRGWACACALMRDALLTTSSSSTSSYSFINPPSSYTLCPDAPIKQTIIFFGTLFTNPYSIPPSFRPSILISSHGHPPIQRGDWILRRSLYQGGWVHSKPYTLYTVWCILYIVLSTLYLLYTVHCTLYTVRRTVYNGVQCTVYMNIEHWSYLTSPSLIDYPPTPCC